MEKTSDDILNDYSQIDKSLQDAIRHLGNYERSIQDYIAECVASICNVDLNSMFCNFDKIHTAHARWLFWYAVKYMTNMSCRCVAEQTSVYGKKYTEQGIARSINKMSLMIENETLWKRRWTIIKKIIKLGEPERNDIPTITIVVPRELKDKVKIEFKEK